MSSSEPLRKLSRWLPWTVLVTASLLLVGSAAFAASGTWPGTPGPGSAARPRVGVAAAPPTMRTTRIGPASGATPTAGTAGRQGGMGSGQGGMGSGRGGPMMDTHIWLEGNGVQVTTIAAARARAQAAAGPSGLHTGEVMQFTSNFYVELKDASGAPAAEVLVDPETGAVVTEYGPGMMWSTNAAPAISAERASAIAGQWLQANAPRQTVDSTDLFPGHYTMDTVTAGNTVGMLSVNATTGAVWYHTWHGTFIAKEDA